MKKLGLDITYLMDQYALRGIGRYTREVSSRLMAKAIEDDNLEVHLFGFSDQSANLRALGISNASGQVHYHELDSMGPKNPLQIELNYYTKLFPLVKKLGLDAYYAPYFEKGLPSRYTKVVATVHDTIPMTTNHYSAKSEIHNFVKGLFYKHMWNKQIRACKLIAISNTTKQALQDLRFEPEQLAVAYNGIGEEFFNPVDLAEEGDFLKEFKLKSGTYLLYDSGLEANKNVRQLVKIFNELRKQLPQLRLVVTGGSFSAEKEPLTKEAQQIRNLARDLKCWDKIVPVGRVSEPELLRLFMDAKAYINFSRAEGFGFGPLQAMAIGIPAIISNNPVFMELSGEAAHVVNVLNVELAAREIGVLLQDDFALAAMVEKGKEHAATFNWDITSDKIWEEIQHCLN